MSMTAKTSKERKNGIISKKMAQTPVLNETRKSIGEPKKKEIEKSG